MTAKNRKEAEPVFCQVAALRYAKVLNELGISKEAVLEAGNIFEKSQELKAALVNPVITKETKHNIIDKVFSEEMRTFLKVVCDHEKMTLVMVDVQGDSLEMNYDKLADAITEKTKVVIPVDLGGVPCDYDRIFSVVESKKHLFHPSNELQKVIGRVVVMADAAHAFGATWKNKPVGSIADFSNFSFHAVKNFTTAEGGAVAWKDIDGIDNEEIYHQYQLLSLHGQSKDALAKTQLGAWEYDIVGPWYKCNMTDVTAGIGLAQMKRYKGLLARRKEIIRRYDEAFKPLGIEVLNHYTEDHQSSGHLYITRVPGISLEQRQEIIVKMAEEGIACNVHYKPLAMMTAYKNMGFDIKDYPNAYKRFENEITLPLHTKLTDEEVEYVIEKYEEIIKKYI